MEKKPITVAGNEFPLHSVRVAVVGSGAAALNAAVHLARLGVDDVAIVTERLGAGVSANAGSDKQTYYRLNPADDAGDSARETANRLFSGGCMHGDVALVEASLSLLEFHHLASLGVPFPFDRYGSHAAYRTDHDERARGSSAGPGTSIMMYEKLRDEAKLLGIPVLEGLTVVDIVTVDDTNGRRAAGIIAMGGVSGAGAPYNLCAIGADYVVLATGGPGALYADSVYPASQAGSLGAAVASGAVAQNLSESQFGIASKRPRWNLSGSYQQALPRYYSTAPDGGGEREFLADCFPSVEALLAAQFRKGYEWPFDVKKITGHGSSCVDLLVYYESVVRGRRVYIDYRSNPSFPGSAFGIDVLPAEARDYLERSNAVGKAPVERLLVMNTPAYELFLKHGIDLAREPLEIAVCHQHVNGGLRGDIWWESSVRNLFPVGEANGSHGVYRPGGAALNAGQVGGLRAAQMIAHRVSGKAPEGGDGRSASVRIALKARIRECRRALAAKPADPRAERLELQRRMSRALGILRDPAGIERAIEENAGAMRRHRESGVAAAKALRDFLKNADLLLAERLFLEASRLALSRIEGGRGSYLVGRIGDFLKIDEEGRARTVSPPVLGGMALGEIVELSLGGDGRIDSRVVPVRPIPRETMWFERVWKEYMEGSVYTPD
ncbi:MAG TPA: FAD-binding protein [Spirochaetota bacterium]|nr:FAD-binding protein [Spirochaetota bacterium]